MFKFWKKTNALDVSKMLEEERAAKADCCAIIKEDPVLQLLQKKFCVVSGLYRVLLVPKDDKYYILAENDDYHILAKALKSISEKLKDFEPANDLIKLDAKIACIKVNVSELEEIVHNEMAEYVLNASVEKISDEWISSKNKELEDALKQADEKVEFIRAVMERIVVEKISPIVADAMRTAYVS